jgi:hypothetical protein
MSIELRQRARDFGYSKGIANARITAFRFAVMREYRHNHYVPIWYQRRFMFPDQDRYYRLDLKPEVLDNGKVKYTKKDLHNWGLVAFLRRTTFIRRNGERSAIRKLSNFSSAGWTMKGLTVSITSATLNIPTSMKLRSSSS